MRLKASQPKSTQKTEESPLSERVIALWLKHDPFIKIIAGDSDEIRREAMLALLGEKAARRFKSTSTTYQKPPMIYPNNVRSKEEEFLINPDKRTRIIRELVYWGSDEKINAENPDSHKTRVQVIHTLLGSIFLNSDPDQEKLIVEGLKVLVVTKTTSLGKTGEVSPVVHEEILGKISEILRYNYSLITNQNKYYTEAVARAQLLKTIQSLKESSHRSAYYMADDQSKSKKLLADKFPLKSDTYNGFLEIVRHYLFSAWSDFRKKAKQLLIDIGEESLIPKTLIDQP